jgi:hypothetical protein
MAVLMKNGDGKPARKLLGCFFDKELRIAYLEL